MNRRDFFRASLSGAAAAVASSGASARPNLEPATEAVGMLYDSTLCVGCKACVAACKEVNEMPPTLLGDDVQYDSAKDLSAETLNVIKIYINGEPLAKDREVDGFAFEKRSCMHCVDPGCVSACPVTALERHPVTGIVSYDIDACIGCRTCMTGCPYNVPPEVNLLAVAHYMQALDVQNHASKVVAILGGKSPHIQNVAVGGVSNSIGHDAPSVLNIERLMLIKNYQAVVPSTWNAGHRDADDEAGPYESSLLDNPVVDPENPLEVLRTVHSFDPCIACAIHMFDNEQQEIVSVRAL